MLTWNCDRLHDLSIVFYLENLSDALWLLLFHFLPGSICSVEIDAVQQRLASKIEVLRKDSAAARRAAPGMLLRRSAARPVGRGSLIRVAAISSGDRNAAVPRPVEMRCNMSPSLLIKSNSAYYGIQSWRRTCAVLLSINQFVMWNDTPVKKPRNPHFTWGGRGQQSHLI